MDITIEEREDKKALRFGDNFTVFEIADIKKEIIKPLSQETVLELDLSEVEECDTAGIQLLLSLMKSARDKENNISFINISDAIRNTAIGIGIDPEESFEIQEV